MFTITFRPDGRKVITFYRFKHYPAVLRYWSSRGRAKAKEQMSAWRSRGNGASPLLKIDLSSSAPGKDPLTALRSHRGSERLLELEVIPPIDPTAPVLRELQDLVESIPAVQRVRFAGRPPRRTENQLGRYERALPLNFDAPTPELKRPVGVFLHLYYHELAEDYRAQLTNIPVPYSLYLSTDTESKAEYLKKVFPDATVRVALNRGRDIGAKLSSFTSEHAAHDLILHLHGKRSTHLLGEGVSWDKHIQQSLLSSPARVRAILAAFEEDRQLGMIGPTPWSPVKLSANWAGNRALADVYSYRQGWPELPDNSDLHFPVGSMFWARTEAIQPLLSSSVRSEDFLEDVGHRDGTLAHVMERLFGVVCRDRGLTYAEVWPEENRPLPDGIPDSV